MHPEHPHLSFSGGVLETIQPWIPKSIQNESTVQKSIQNESKILI
jgi:hypothetical protein